VRLSVIAASVVAPSCFASDPRAEIPTAHVASDQRPPAIIGYLDCEAAVQASAAGKSDLSGYAGGMSMLDRIRHQFADDETKCIKARRIR
jgi:hypothetical protein